MPNATQRKAAQRASLEAAIKRTMNELIASLSHNEKGVEAATALSALTDQLEGADLVCQLGDMNSDVCRAIPVALLTRSAGGREFLKGLSIIQPRLFDIRDQGAEAPEPARPEPDADVHALLGAGEQTAPIAAGAKLELSERMAELLGGDENNVLLDLANQVFSSGCLDQQLASLSANPESFDLMGMMSAVGEVLSQKAAESDVDIGMANEQAQKVMGNLMQTNPGLAHMVSMTASGANAF